MDPTLRERAALVALLRLPGARWNETAHEVLEADSAVGVLERRLRLQDVLFDEDDAVEKAIVEAAGDITAWREEGLGFHAFFDAGYPTQLRDVHQMPPILFTRGTPTEDRCAIAVVGTRQATERGLGIARTVATELARNKVTVVSGLARGIDTAAHEAALAAGGRTVAVIGTGIRRHYPAENHGLQDRIAREGLVASQFWPDAPPSKQSFPMRNAVMSGYAAATLVVEAPWRSGARIQARLALEHGRSVIMPNELLEHDWAREFAERPGVHVVRDVDAMLESADQVIREAQITPDSFPEVLPFAWT
ncbi:DNA-processing protein DprA [Thermomonospora umbrina]|uniref:DNA processing protein n=1 Tax=Thermomonospora umbrina TaxID=111806 RepID=A0A3D9T0F0_9ACTN|nr:DNA-processing protein DprA [Thermomonospora umbrina]REE98745.1 DNA processing protein [Thermomonospora umbrina]